MRATRLILTADSADWARIAAERHDRLRHLGDRLRLRGWHRAELPPENAGRPTRRARC